MRARAGLRVVMPEADGHGERFDGDATARLLRFWDIVRGCIDEMSAIREDLEDRRLVKDGRIGVAGLSMGGFVALGLARLKVPNSVRGVMPVVVIPLIAKIVNFSILAFVLVYFLRAPVTAYLASRSTRIPSCSVTRWPG